MSKNHNIPIMRKRGVKGGEGAQLCTGKMKRLLTVIVILALCSVFVFADDLRMLREDVPNKHLVGPGGIYMMLSNYNRNIQRDVVQGYESELQVFTPEFKENIIIFPNALVGIFVVKGDKIVDIIAQASSVPAIPADGFLVVGHGRAAVGFMVQFEIGDKVTIKDYTPKIASAAKAKEVVIMPNGEEVVISGWNRGRCADEVVAYDSDYADKTYTNEWGHEFAVEGDEVIEVRAIGNKDVLEIPKKGFAISAHGTMISSVSSAMEGDLVELD